MGKQLQSIKNKGIKQKILVSKTTKIISVAIISLISITVVSLIITFSITTLLKNRRNSQFEFEIIQIDRLLDQGRVKKAEIILRELEVEPLGISGGLSLIKRAQLISKRTGNYQLMEDYAQPLWKKYPDYQDVTALYVFSLLRNNHGTKAFKVADKYLISKKFSSLKAEAWLKAIERNSLETDLTLSKEEKDLLSIENFSNESADRLIPYYKNALKSSHDERLIKNLVLLYCAKGDFHKAFELALVKLKSIAPDLFLQISYDAKQYEEARSVILPLERQATGEDLANLMLIHADLFLHSGDYLAALNKYRRVIELFPNYSVIPYLNLYPISQKISNEDQVRYRLTSKQLMKFYEPIFSDNSKTNPAFRENIELILYYAQLLRENSLNKKNLIKLKSLLEGYIQKNVADTQIALMYHIVTDSSQINNHIAQIQMLMIKDPDNELLPQYLAYYLSAFPDHQFERDQLLNTSDQYFHDRQWQIFYHGYYALMLDKYPKGYEQSLTYFEKLIQMSDRWEYYYDAGLINFHLAKFDDAELMADKALSLLQAKALDSFDRGGNLSLVITLQGLIYEREQKWSDASRAYNQALEYDHTNIDAVLSLQKINSEHRE